MKPLPSLGMGNNFWKNRSLLDWLENTSSGLPVFETGQVGSCNISNKVSEIFLWLHVWLFLSWYEQCHPIFTSSSYLCLFISTNFCQHAFNVTYPIFDRSYFLSNWASSYLSQEASLMRELVFVSDQPIMQLAVVGYTSMYLPIPATTSRMWHKVNF